ncbi:hypothetical protein [Persephonella sp.]|uniref:hypothetical protein n=1 Tax=Persephonella sp. TaxID=2060922 RepID=UPI00262605B1|nr:hypothetical protein [Persephonella sp.]
MEKNVYIHYLIGELESYVIDNRNKIEKLISNQKKISVQDSVFIFDKFSNSLRKTKDLIKLSREINDRDTLRTISIISSETVAWVMFTLPSIESSMPVFLENLIVYDRHIIDALGELLLEFDEFIETPEKLKAVNPEVFNMINEISMTFGHLSKMIEKGAVEN